MRPGVGLGARPGPGPKAAWRPPVPPADVSPSRLSVALPQDPRLAATGGWAAPTSPPHLLTFAGRARARAGVEAGGRSAASAASFRGLAFEVRQIRGLHQSQARARKRQAGGSARGLLSRPRALPLPPLPLSPPLRRPREQPPPEHVTQARRPLGCLSQTPHLFFPLREHARGGE